MQTPPRRPGANSPFRLPLLAAAALLCLAAPARAGAQICPLSVQSTADQNTAAAPDTATADSSSRGNRDDRADRGQRPERRRRPIPPGTVETAAASSCVDDQAPPVVDSFDPASGTVSSTAALSVTISWHDEVALDQYGYYITLNGANVTSSFVPGYYTTWAQATGTVTLSPGSNTLTIQVWDQAGNYATAAATYTYTAPPQVVLPAPAFKPARTLDPAQVSAGMVHPGSAIRRDMCLTISVGPGAAYECGDLRLVHALPSMRVLNTPRTAALIYNSQHAQPRPVFPFNLQMDVGSIPSAVRAVLWVSEVGQPAAVRAQKTWTAASWSSGLWRFALSYDAALDSTNVYVYTLEVFTTIGGVESKVRTYTGDLAVVNRANSPFGAGWWLAGLERLVYVPGDGSFLRVGGDGSTQRYFWAAPGMWTAPLVDRADTLWAGGPSFAYGFNRKLPNGSVVWYDGDLRHSRTTTRLGHTTSFRYDGPGRLDLITLPKPAGGTVEAQYVFGYDTGGRLEWVCAIVSGTNCRNTIMQYALGDRRVTGITGPDAFPVTFGYTGTGREVRGRTDRLGTRTTFTYDPGGRMRQAWRMVAGDTIMHTITATESQGLTTAQVTASTYTSYNGPRHPTDVVDISRIWVNRWGAPTRVRDPGLNITYLTRTDFRFPALVTRVDYPNGGVVSAEYDVRGNLKAQTDWSHSRTLADGAVAYATSRYERTNPTFPDFVTQATMPEGEVSFTDYHADGSVAWQQPGSDAARRVRFDYNSLGLVEWVTMPATSTQGESRQRLEYDGRGNLQAATTPNGYRTVYHNDLLGRTWKTESPIDGVRSMVNEVTFYPNTDRVEYAYTTGPDMNGSGQQTVTVHNVYDAEGRPRSVARRSDPDPNYVNWVTTQFRYDEAGRQVAEIAPDGMVDSTFYDLASNPVRRRTRNFAELLRAAGGDPAAAYLVTRYDALNRPYEHIIPAVHYLERRAGVASSEYFLLLKQRPYPHYPNDGGTGLRIAGDTVRFAYDVMGNMVRAENHDSWIRRSYYPNGLLKGDTLKVRTLAELAQGGDSTSHAYALLHVYDLNGRRRELHHPAQLAPQVNGAAPLPARFGYDPHLGTLSSVTDPLGSEFRYEYDSRGQQQALSLPGGIRETYGYDADGSLTSHRVFNGAPYPVAHRYPGDWIRDETLEYDRRGKMLETRNLYGNRDVVSAQYSGLGHMVQTTSRYYGYTFDTDQSTLYVDTETPRHDALGNIQSMHRSGALRVFERTWLDAASAHSSHDNTAWTYQPGTGRLLRRTTPTGVDSTHYDAAGNIVFTNQTATVGAVAYDRASFYDGEGRLRVVDSRRVENFGDKAAPYFRVFEEYRYDALGRRVVVHTRKDCKNVGQDLRPCAVGTLRRTVWDGSAELYDIQVPTSSDNTLVNVFFSTAELESDTNPVRGNLGNWDGFDPYPMYGRVAYTYGHTVDKPLSIIRMNYADQPYGSAHLLWAEPFAIVPHWNMRGAAQTGTYANGARHRCLPNSTRCVALDWPDGWFPYNPVRLVPEHWHGSLLSEKRDGSGLLYRRNRYYDPSSSRFTQEDPIGLAGGLNAYGFAAGDPVSYSDPYGLKPQDVFVSCRPVRGTEDFGHCAVRVVNEKLNIDVTYELLSTGRPFLDPQTAGQTSPDQVARYENWVQVGVPQGQTSDEFDLRVIEQAESISAERNGRTYIPFGGANSNRFVYDIVTRAGGRVPFAAGLKGRIQPGLCGGRGMLPGFDCKLP